MLYLIFLGLYLYHPMIIHYRVCMVSIKLHQSCASFSSYQTTADWLRELLQIVQLTFYPWCGLRQRRTNSCTCILCDRFISNNTFSTYPICQLISPDIPPGTLWNNAWKSSWNPYQNPGRIQYVVCSSCTHVGFSAILMTIVWEWTFCVVMSGW